MREQRNCLSFNNLKYGPRVRVELSTNCDVDEEIFASLKYISEISTVGIPMVKSYGHSRPKEVFLLLQSFIRQAKSFYDAAKKMDYRVSSLIYYYSFLNLAKAYICLTDPMSINKRITHGISYKYDNKGFPNQTLHINNNEGVFHFLYKKIIGKDIPKKISLNIVRLLGYCSDISFEYENAKYGQHKLLPTLIKCINDPQNHLSWPLLVVGSFAKIKPYNKSLTKFNNYFEEVKPIKNIIHELFNIEAGIIHFFSFFESKTPTNWLTNDLIPTHVIQKDVFDVIGNLYMSNNHVNEYNFIISIPYNKNRQLAFNEPLAIYSVMFYLGSLVRYYPKYLENLFDSKDAWLIERFTSSSAITFLKYIANLILGKDYVYKPR